ncbi:MBL fold metallo-hydrolase [Halomicroarcula limicola]|uniref:MBL fold metallo-hydrolase n=1 Tax=Haloarcula limicola TaxID=1429915 RepID=A0A8J8C7N1_9EURY|nr:MBL fold metallo-hydrolase [Halomicroarcula limicola]MBV0925183.1 MBL fold metallo-hydrolase [Halomicroarcula limicola]
MRLSFHHANPDDGNESFLVRFGTESGANPCVLVDAGHGVDLDALLRPEDRLVAICLTHAHLDHYSSLSDAHRDDVPILASPATAAVLDDVFDVAAVEAYAEISSAVTDAITPVDDWTSLTDELAVHPVPAGHVPGAVGFLLRASDADRTQQLLVTGDFTVRSAGGFPGFAADGFFDVDVLFLTGATDDGFEGSLTDALGKALDRAHGGSRTLVAASGIVGPQIAYLLSGIVDEYDLRVPIRLVGQAAKLYDALDYDCAGVEAIPHFDHTDECLDAGTIAIAGPEIPTERSSGRLFGVLREDPNACVVQLVGSGHDPLSQAQCTIHSYEFANHPTGETLRTVHDAVDPTQTVVTHRHGGAKNAFNDLSSVVWGAGDTDEYTLFDGERWRLPPWMPGTTVRRSRGRSVQQLAGDELLDSFALPSLERRDTVELEAEGIDRERLETLLHLRVDATNRNVPTTTDESTTDDTPRETTVTSMNSDETDPSDSTETARATDGNGLVKTTGVDLKAELDPRIQAAMENGELTEAEVETALASRERAIAKQIGEDVDAEAASESESADTATAAETSDADIDESSDAGAAPRRTADGDATSEGATDGSTDVSDDAGDGSRDAGDDEANGGPTDSETTETAPTSASGTDREPDDAFALDLDPLAIALAARAAEGESVERWIETAVENYVLALLAGEAAGDPDARLTVDIETSPVLDSVLTATVDDDDRFDSVRGLVTTALADQLSDTTGIETAESIRLPEPTERYLDAIVANDEYGFETVADVAETAILSALQAD